MAIPSSRVAELRAGFRFVMLGGRAPVTAAGNYRWRRSHYPFGRIAIGPDSLGANDPDVSCRDTPAA
jgi:hypothetical protein